MQIEKKKTSYLKNYYVNFFVTHGDKAFGNQVYEWLWSKGAHSFEDMTNISKETRAMLEQLRHQPH
jgi:23S rRNA (adenine2503-C2)-methyltransferase